MDDMSDDVLLKELNKRFLDNKKALHDLKVMHEKIEKLNGKLAESERLKTDFLSNIRNEINNPLTAILGIARQLAGPVKDEKTRRDMAQLLHNEAFDLDFQLRNIFIAAELEAGETVLKTTEADIAALIQGIITSFAHRAQEKDVTVEFSCPDRAGERNFFFRTDPEKLQIAVANLLANAIEFNEAGKNVNIEARREDNFLHISVRDQGKGISEQDRERLFERFHQLDHGASKKHKGHGIGLCITKALVEMLGGKMFLEQAGEGGSIFKLSIPEAAAATGDLFSGDHDDFLNEGENRF